MPVAGSADGVRLWRVQSRRVPVPRYRELPPPGALAPFVACLWMWHDDPTEAAPHRVLPDGCIDVVIGGAPGRTEALVVGSMTRPLVITSREPASFVGVRFRPAQARRLLGIPAAELTNLRVAAGDVVRGIEPALEPPTATADLEARVRALAAALRARLPLDGAPPPAVIEALRRIERSGGTRRVTTLAPELGVTRQHLARQFAEFVGVSPKTYARVVRLHRAIAQARARPPSGWAAIAAAHGYYDQAHLVDEFRELVGVTPSEWRGGT